MPRKGQSLSVESIEQMKKAKLSRQLSKYNWLLVESYWDIEINNGSANRKKKFLTFRQFKNLCEQGYGIIELQKQGYCKHLLQFFSNFLQGKISLTKDIFEREYLSGKSLDEISSFYGVTREDMIFLRQIYDIDRKGAKFIYRKETETPLTQRQKEILYGSMMGDAKRASPASAGFGHGTYQKEYLLWKYKEFENITSKVSLKSTTYIDTRSGNELVDNRFYTHANTDIEKINNEFYISGKKQVSLSVLENLTPLSVAVWFMDDGKTDHNYRSVVSNMKIMTPVCTFCTDSFSKESCENIQKFFIDKYGIKTRLKERRLSNRIGYRVIIENESTNDFLKLIVPHILPMFMYKIDYGSYLDKIEADVEYVDFAEIINCPIGELFSKLSLNDQDIWINKIVSYYHRIGFEKLIKNPNNYIKDMNLVFEKDSNRIIHDDCIGFSNIGNIFLMSHFPNFWAAKAKANKSCKELFEDRKYLSEIVREILLEDYFPRKNRILSKLKRYRGNKAISGFMPSVAKAVYDKYCKENSKVLDFCGGYGGRLFGAMASNKVESYTCSEVNFKSYLGLNELYRNLRMYRRVEKKALISNQDSLVSLKSFADKSFDLCFTSPPYFDAEEYDESNSQSCIKYSSYGNWFNNFLWSCIQEAMRVSKCVIINIAKTGSYDIPADLENYLKKGGINYEINYLRMPSFGSNKYREEPLFILKGEKL